MEKVPSVGWYPNVIYNDVCDVEDIILDMRAWHPHYTSEAIDHLKSHPYALLYLSNLICKLDHPINIVMLLIISKQKPV